MVLFHNKSLLFEGVRVTAKKERVNCSFGFVLAFPRLLKCRDLGGPSHKFNIKAKARCIHCKSGFSLKLSSWQRCLRS